MSLFILQVGIVDPVVTLMGGRRASSERLPRYVDAIRARHNWTAMAQDIANEEADEYLQVVYWSHNPADGNCLINTKPVSTRAVIFSWGP